MSSEGFRRTSVPGVAEPGTHSSDVAAAREAAPDRGRRRVVTAMAGACSLVLAGCKRPSTPARVDDLPLDEDTSVTISSHPETWRGKRVVDFRMGDTASQGEVVYRLYQEYDTEETQQQLVDHFFGQVDPAGIESLIVGPWQVSHDDGPDGILDGLIARKDALTALRALYVGDITFEENEMSWIVQTDYARLLAAFPALEALRVRGSQHLEIPPFEHRHLQELALETGGLPSRVVRGIAASTLPALRHLELWLGDDSYGFDGDVQTYADLLAAIEPARLQYLGLRNAMIGDALASWLAQQPWLAELEVLDLSMGTLGDVGAQALFESPHLRGLKRLDLSHHYIGEAWQAKLRTLPLEVVLADPQQEDEYDGERYRYVEVGE